MSFFFIFLWLIIHEHPFFISLYTHPSLTKHTLSSVQVGPTKKTQLFWLSLSLFHLFHPPLLSLKLFPLFSLNRPHHHHCRAWPPLLPSTTIIAVSYLKRQQQQRPYQIDYSFFFFFFFVFSDLLRRTIFLFSFVRPPVIIIVVCNTLIPNYYF